MPAPCFTDMKSWGIVYDMEDAFRAKVAKLILRSTESTVSLLSCFQGKLCKCCTTVTGTQGHFLNAAWMDSTLPFKL